MKNISCRIVEDLLPLYVDGICSEESRIAVAAHIETCSECRRKYEQMSRKLPQDEIQSNIDESIMLRKLSDTWNSKTKLNYQASVFCGIFYVLAVVVLSVLPIFFEKGYYRFETSYLYAFVGITFILYFLFGMLLAFLANRPKGTTKTKILELIVIGIPSLLMITSVFTTYLLPFRIPKFILENADTLSMIGAILLGCELYRAITKK